MTHFDEMNTADSKHDGLLDCAMRSEQSRGFKPCAGRFSVGLSSGTPSRHRLFIASPYEQQMWAAGVLTKVLPDGLFAKERMALFLCMDNNLYQSVNNHQLGLDFYDLLAPFQAQLKLLQQRAPTIIVVPAQVSRTLALEVTAGELMLEVKRVISIAEVLGPQGRELLRNVFRNVGEIYQTTEGFLVSTCRCGTLHLNEEFVHIELQWLDEHRFVPIVTDFTRTIQPIMRYRLNDVLVVSEQPYSCDSAAMAIARIGGQQDDQLQLPARLGNIQTIFADACSRVLVMTLPLTVGYRLLQTESARLTLITDYELWMLEHCQEALNALFIRQDIAIGQLVWLLEPQTVPVFLTAKRRRIVRQWERG